MRCRKPKSYRQLRSITSSTLVTQETLINSNWPDYGMDGMDSVLSAQARFRSKNGGATGLEPAASAVTVSGVQVLLTTWKRTEGNRNHLKYVVSKGIVYRR